MLKRSIFAGLVAAGEHPSPIPHADVTTTTIHKTLCGPRSGMILCKEELAADINRSVFAKAGWDRYAQIGSDDTGKGHADVFSVGVGYRF